MRLKNNLLLLVQLTIFISYANSALDCTKSFTYKGQTKSFGACNTLTGPAALAWTYDPANSTLEIAFLAQASSATGWVGWGINLGPKPVMIGTNALVGFRNGGQSVIEQYKLTTDVQAGGIAVPGHIDIDVQTSAVEISGTTITLFATIQLHPNQTKINHVWNRGTKTLGLRLLPHETNAEDLRGYGTIDLSSSSIVSTEPPHQTLKNNHGALNTVGWGIFLPLGIMTARYAKQFTGSGWFYVHVVFQSLGLLLGVIGWIIGLKLGSYSIGIVYHHHRNIGLAIFIFACFQLLGALLKPGQDHKLRRYWQVYHHSIGYVMIILIFTNIYKGFNILQPRKRWKNAYSGFVALVVVASFIFEVTTWLIYFKRKRNIAKANLSSTDEYQQQQAGSRVQMGSTI